MKKFMISLTAFVSLGIYGSVNISNVNAKSITFVSNIKKQKISIEYQNAFYNAKSYLTIFHMSEKGIYDQLISGYGDGFSSASAKYAIRQLNKKYHVNWYKVALQKAKEYQSEQHMSKRAIHDQLDYEGFTLAQANYAVNYLPGY